MAPLLSKPLVARVHIWLDRPWYLPFVAVLAFANAFVPFIAIEIFLVARVWAHPRRWAWQAIFVASGCALGAFALATAVGSDGAHAELGQALIARMQGAAWDRASDWIRRYGALGLGFISMSFVPQQPAIVIAALAGMKWYEIALPIFVARAAKYLFWCAIAVHAPHWLVQHEGVRRALPERGKAHRKAPGRR